MVKNKGPNTPEEKAHAEARDKIIKETISKWL